jgi:hypothetical protein
MATKKYISENSTVNNIDISYMGDITYKKSHQTFSSGEQFNLKYVTQDPVDYIIAKDVFSVLTKPEFYSETFDNIREEKQGTGVSDYQLSALAQNDYFGSESLSAVAETETGEYAIAISDIVSDNNFSDLVVYSFSSKVSYAGSSGFYWKYQSDTLNYELSPENFTDDNYFYFNFIDGQYCNIIKNLSGGSKYLTYDTGLSSLIFQTDEDEDYSRFTYSYNSKINQIMLGVENVGIIGFTETAELSVLPTNSIINELTNTFSLDNKNALNQEELIINSFMPYYSNKNNLSQNFEVDNIGLYTHNYNSNIEKNSNYIPLKSNVIYDEKYSLVNVDQSPHFRQYTSINSGIRGDSGYNNFILGYNSHHYKYDFKPDKQTYFNVPFELGGGYTQININDCKMVENGAIGGNSPLNSDKIYKKLYEYSDFKNTGITANVDNSKYLCSWLWYNPLYPSQSKWLDRYYNPDVVTQLSALSEYGWNTLSSLESFSTSNDLEGAYETYYKEFDKTVGVFDVESKMTIQPNALYVYERLGIEKSQLLHNELSSFILDSRVNEDLDFNNNFYLLTDTSYGDEEFTMNIVLDNFDLDNFSGNKIFGNRTISLTVDKNFSPYNIAVSGSIIHYYDFDYNHIKSLDLSSNIDDIIFTDDFNKFYVDCGGVIYTVESLDFITNETVTLSGNDNISDIKYYNQKLYVLDTSSNLISSYSPELDELVELQETTDELFIIVDGEIYTGNGDYIDYGNSQDIYTLRSNEIFYKDISTPIISSSDNFVDFYVDSDNVIYILKHDSIYKISNDTLTEVLTSQDILPSYGLSSFNINRYQRNGEIYEYIDVYDKSGLSSNIHRYDKDLNHVETLTRTISGDFIRPKSRLNTKYLDKKITLKVTLFDIFSYYKKGDVELEIDQRYIDESKQSVLNFIFSNKFGTITTYFNGALIDIFKFDNEQYFFSNTLRDNKIFFGSSIINDEETIDSVVLSSNNDMISGKCSINDISIYNTSFNYFDVINYNRVHATTIPENSLVIPIKNRSYIEEIAGFYNQNKNMRKSEYGSVNIYGTELSDENQNNVKNEIEQLFVDTFINLRINETTFK